MGKTESQYDNAAISNQTMCKVCAAASEMIGLVRTNVIESTRPKSVSKGTVIDWYNEIE